MKSKSVFTCSSPSVVLSSPAEFSIEMESRIPSIVKTSKAFSDLFSEAKRGLKILAPYVDPTFTSLVAAVHCPVKIVTVPCPGRPSRLNPVLKRCSILADLSVRYLPERRDRALIFQMHSKLIIADCETVQVAYVGSANLTDTSVHYNLELGLMIDDKNTVADLERIFDFLFDQAVPAKSL